MKTPLCHFPFGKLAPVEVRPFQRFRGGFGWHEGQNLALSKARLSPSSRLQHLSDLLACLNFEEKALPPGASGWKERRDSQGRDSPGYTSTASLS